MLSWLRKNTKSIMIIVVVLFAGSMFYGLGYRGLKGDWGGGKRAGNGLARVNGTEVNPLRYREFVNRVSRGFGENLSPSDMAFIENLALGQTVDFTLLYNEARKKVKVSGGELDAAIDNLMRQQQIPSKRELENALRRVGLTLGKFRELIKEDIMVQKLNMKMQEGVRLTPDDLREIRASHILVTTEAEARRLSQQLKGGADFAALARQYSRDTGSAAKGGDLGYFTTGMMVTPFEQAAFALKTGEISGIVKSDFGYHLIKLTDSRLKKFNVPDNQVEPTALRDKQDRTFKRWYSELRSRAKVEIENPVLKGHDYRFRGLVPQAIEEYKQGIAAEPANPALRIYLGDLYLASGRKDLALSEYENAVKMEGGNPLMYIVLGKAYEAAGEKELASAQFRKASLVAGDDKLLHEQLLKLFQQLKKSGEVAREKEELKRIEKKEQFLKEMQGTGTK